MPKKSHNFKTLIFHSEAFILLRAIVLLQAIVLVFALPQSICAPVRSSLIAQNWQPKYQDPEQSGHTDSDRTTTGDVHGSEYGYTNSAKQIFPVHPFSAQFIAQSGERFVKQIRNHALQTNRENDPEVQAKIEAALFSGGAAAIRQGHHGDCWFEAGLAAVARTPKGQQLLSDMILQDSPSSYIVTFPWRGWWRRVTNEDLTNEKTQDNAQWARVIETAAAKNWPNFIEGHRTAGTPFRGEDADVMALTILTGTHAKTFQLSQCSLEKIRQILEEGCAQQQPMEASSLVNPDPWIIVHNHAYTIMAYDPANRIVTLRNPWARSGQPNDRGKNPQLLFFGESKAGVHDIGGGLLQMPVSSFKRLFAYLSGHKHNPIFGLAQNNAV